MPYTHSGKSPVVMSRDPIDPDGTDWVFFSLTGWLRDSETVVAHEALIEGGEIVTDSTFLGTIDDTEGTTHTNVYAVQFKPVSGALSVTVTLRVSTTTSGVDLARLNIDHSVEIPVETL